MDEEKQCYSKMNFHTEAIIENIILCFGYGITEVKDIEYLEPLFAYTTENIYQLTSIIKKGDYEKAQVLEKARDLLNEDLTLFRFKDQNNQLYYGFYYDSVEPFQNPVVMDIYPAIL